MFRQPKQEASSRLHQRQAAEQLQDFRRHRRQQQQQEDQDDEELQWRQAAQMLTDDDEIILATTGRADNQQRLSAPAGWSGQRGTPDSNRAGEQARDYLEEDGENSSISFAQSGCHSILSAWRLKAANKARQRDSAKLTRPTSVLSNASSARKSVASTAFTLRSSGRAPASQTRIPLGPRQAQHFVTNTRRRRRANELILNTLEARRRTLALNRQNASLLGSATYLNAPDVCFPEHVLFDTGADPASQRLSLSPSPVGFRGRSPSPAPRRSTLSDLGGSRQAARRQLASPVQRELLRNLSGRSPAPPLAKLDQNSSDLYTSNSSSSGSSDSSNSQFTQLVTSELAPDCVLLENQALRERFHQRTRPVPVPVQKEQAKVKAPTPPPRLQERRKRPLEAKRPAPKEDPRADSTEDNGNNKLRRGALRRDSIRRLRLNRQPQGKKNSSGSSTSSEAAPYSSETSMGSPQDTNVKQQPLPLTRKLDIENNPFLNRGHFRSTSVRGESLPRSEFTVGHNSPTRNQQEPTNGRGSQQERRNSWLMGTRRASSRELESRFLSDPGRSNSSEAIDGKRNKGNFNEANKVGKQQDERQEVRAVDRATLSQMKPNEVFSSSSVESSQHQRTMRRTVLESRPGQLFASGEPRERQQAVAREASVKSRNDLKLDAPGNRRSLDSERKWRNATSEPEMARKQIGSRTEEKLVRSEKMDIFRSTSISPPMGFSDGKPRTRLVVMDQQPLRLRNSQLQAAAKLTGSTPSINSQEASSGRQLVGVMRATSVERPPVAARKRTAPPVAERPASLQAAKNQLPTFERTGDDEFRKRVDYLRKLARSNLENSPDVERSTKTSAAAAKPLTKPPTTNWRHSVDSAPSLMKNSVTSAPKPPVPVRSSLTRSDESKSLFDERANWRLGPLADKPLAQARPGPATTNLDSILTDRYQSREQLAAGTLRWHRSNSSLASLGNSKQSTSGSSKQPSANPRAQFPNLDRQQHERSLMATTFDAGGPKEPAGQSEVVKLVVKERSAPRLNYAFVEQQPSVQHALGRAAPTPTPPKQPQQQQHQQAGSNQASCQTNKLPPRQPANPTGQRSRSPLRVAAPRSPEFGATAASSNDDSAIASSVSSPSLSYMVNPNKPTDKPAAPTPTHGQQSSAASATSRPQLVGLRPPLRLLQADSAGASGALQSILRRANQQHLSGESSDSSGPQLPSAEALAGELVQQQQQQLRALSPKPQQQATKSSAADSSAPKRVHFNDRTSVRSFESVSSLNSNSTAVPNELAMLRQQVGSPDSMGSGSGRLSAESPDHRKGGGAAIYAVRGDPEVEAEPSAVNFISAVGLHTTAQLTRNPYGQQARYPLPGSQQQQQQPYIKMTAPPTISTSATQSAGPQLAHQLQQHGYIVRPTSSTSTHIIPAPYAAPNPRGRAFAPEMDQDEDPSYSVRLRQAATSRAFQYAPPQGPMLSPRQQGLVMHQPQQQVRLLPAAGQVHQQQPIGRPMGQQPVKRPLNAEEYLNFHTEV